MHHWIKLLRVISQEPIIRAISMDAKTKKYKCPMEIRECPHGWDNCNLCANFNLCINDMYKPEEETPDIDVVIKAAETSEKVMNAEVKESVDKIRGTWAEKFESMSEDERWADYYKYHQPNLLVKEPITCMNGPTEPGGGGKCKVPKKPPKKLAEYLSEFAH